MKCYILFQISKSKTPFFSTNAYFFLCDIILIRENYKVTKYFTVLLVVSLLFNFPIESNQPSIFKFKANPTEILRCDGRGYPDLDSKQRAVESTAFTV